MGILATIVHMSEFDSGFDITCILVQDTRFLESQTMMYEGYSDNHS